MAAGLAQADGLRCSSSVSPLDAVTCRGGVGSSPASAAVLQRATCRPAEQTALNPCRRSVPNKMSQGLPRTIAVRASVQQSVEGAMDLIVLAFGILS